MPTSPAPAPLAPLLIAPGGVGFDLDGTVGVEGRADQLGLGGVIDGVTSTAAPAPTRPPRRSCRPRRYWRCRARRPRWRPGRCAIEQRNPHECARRALDVVVGVRTANLATTPMVTPMVVATPFARGGGDEDVVGVDRRGRQRAFRHRRRCMASVTFRSWQSAHPRRWRRTRSRRRRASRRPSSPATHARRPGAGRRRCRLAIPKSIGLGRRRRMDVGDVGGDRHRSACYRQRLDVGVLQVPRVDYHAARVARRGGAGRRLMPIARMGGMSPSADTLEASI